MARGWRAVVSAGVRRKALGDLWAKSEHRSWLLLDDLHRASQSALLPFCVESFEHAPHWLRHPHSHLFAGRLPGACFTV
jgi:hypothetical protein